jgi:hypothetical protein
MPFGDGDLLSSMGVSALAPLTGLTAMFSDFNSFDVTAINTQVLAGANELLNTANDYIYGVKPDIADTSPLSFVANPANYPGCTNADFLLDSYVPSNVQNPVYVSCTRPGTNSN